MSLDERGQVLVAKMILGFWCLVGVALGVLLIVDIFRHASDYWYTFGPGILLIVAGLVLWGLGWSFVWAINKVFPSPTDEPDML